MDQAEETDLSRAVDRLRGRMNDPRLLLVPGLRDDLASIAAALREADYRIQSLEQQHAAKAKR